MINCFTTNNVLSFYGFILLSILLNISKSKANKFTLNSLNTRKINFKKVITTNIKMINYQFIRVYRFIECFLSNSLQESRSKSKEKCKIKTKSLKRDGHEHDNNKNKMFWNKPTFHSSPPFTVSYCSKWWNTTQNVHSHWGKINF